MLKESNPIIIEKDNTVIERLKIVNPSGFAIVVKANNVTIKECDLQGGINLYGSVHDVTIVNNFIHDFKFECDSLTAKQIAGVSTTESEGIFKNQSLGAHDITVRGNYFENVSTGVYIVGAKGNIEVDGNFCKNQFGPFPRGQICQFYKCNTTPDTYLRIENNFSYIDGALPLQMAFMTNGRWGGEDHINCNHCFGCEESPIVIRNNYIYGGSGSTSNSGIMAGDGAGAYYHILDNTVYYSENCGIGLCGGTGSVVKGNRIFQDRPIAWGTREEGRGLQIECYGTEFYGENLFEDNVVAFKTTRPYKYCNMLCRTDTAVFKNNKLCESAEEFGELDKFPEQAPPSADDSLIKPWELREKEKFDVI